MYDNPDIPIGEAMEAILSDEGIQLAVCRLWIMRNCRRKQKRRHRKNCRSKQRRQRRKKCRKHRQTWCWRDGEFYIWIYRQQEERVTLGLA